MTQAKEIEGKDLMLFLDGKTIALATSCKLTVNREYGDVRTKDTGKWTKKSPRNVTWSGSSDNLFSVDNSATGFKTLFDAQMTGKELKAQFGVIERPENEEMPENGWVLPDGTYEGNVVITTLDLTAPQEGEATFTVSFDGSGAIEYKTTTPGV